MWWWPQIYTFLKLVYDDLMDEVASRPGTLQLRVMEITEVKKK